MRRLKISVFLVSLAALAFELAVVRLASFLLLGQYAYFALAVAVLGGGIGAALVARYPTLGESGPWLARLVGTSFGLATAGLVFPWPDPLRAGAFVVFAGLPYLSVGFWISRAFKAAKGRASELYFSDLTGAAAGVVAGVAVMQWVGPLVLAATISLLALGLGWGTTLARARLRVLATVATIAVAAAGLATAGAGLAGTSRGLVPMRSKPMGSLEAFVGLPLWSRWSSFSRVDVLKSGDPNRLIVFTDGAAPSEAIRYDGDLADVAYLRRETGALPFALKAGGKTLVIGPGGGKDILLSLAAGSQDVTAVEVNPLVVRAVSELRDFTGDPYNDPRVRTVVADGRSFVESSREQYDLIYLSLVMTGTAERNAWGLNENYIYTVEALEDYLAKLRPGGQVAFVLHDGGDVVRAISLSLQAFMDRGVAPQDAISHLGLFVRQSRDTSPLSHGRDRPVLIVSGDRPDAAEAARWESLAAEANMTAVLSPDRDPKDTLLAVLPGQTAKEAINTYVKQFAALGFDARPVTDDRPFFYAAAQGAPGQVLLTLVAALVAGLGILVFGLPTGQPGRKTVPVPGATAAWLVAAASGFGYMLVEVTLIQTLRGLVAEPTLAVSVILVALLAASGLGSLWASRFGGQAATRAVLIAAVVTALTLLAYPTLTVLARGWLAAAGLLPRLASAAAAAAVLGFGMGLPFPYALNRGESPAALWMVNGVFSVVGSVAALLVAMVAGLSFSLGLGALAYGGIAVCLAVSGREAGAVWVHRRQPLAARSVATRRDLPGPDSIMSAERSAQKLSSRASG